MENLEKASMLELIEEIKKRITKDGMSALIPSKSNGKVLSKLKEDENLPIGVVLTFGYPDSITKKTHECSRCLELKSHEHFTYYFSRIDADGYLMRSNAICDTCSETINKDRKQVLETAQKEGKIGPKPKKGDICPHCERSWDGNWHQHHDLNDNVEWICGLCNMSFNDQRTPKNTGRKGKAI